MHRTSLQPLRTRRVAPTPSPIPAMTRRDKSGASPQTRQTLGAIGALWLAFAGGPRSR